ncbi:recombinase family protein [uncultured Cohaesibacter sp.]|uniref:recombinase family protein n=1 Tax=uncultured Cohaesibacter sp. TaxID=1002546 RepID=UPI0029C83815|nr:recombinase family protein [uncultured Cohaesibacter sp.]
MTTIFYARVSTADQTLDHQITQAKEAGFKIDEVVSDHGVSGVSTRLCERREGKRLFDLLRSGDTLVVRWVDRLGRNYDDVTDTMRELLRRGVTIKTVINGMTFDGSKDDPMTVAVRDALIGFMAAMAQAETETRKAAQRAGIEAAKQKEDKYRGRKPTYSRKQFKQVQDMLASSATISNIAKETGLTRQTIYRIKDTPETCERSLALWGI